MNLVEWLLYAASIRYVMLAADPDTCFQSRTVMAAYEVQNSGHERRGFVYVKGILNDRNRAVVLNTQVLRDAR